MFTPLKNNKSLLCLLTLLALGSSAFLLPAQQQSSTETDAIGRRADGAADTGLHYLFNEKPKDGSLAKTANRMGGNLGAKLKALDSLNGQGMGDSLLRARFEKFLGMEEIPAAKAKAYQTQVDRILRLLKEKKTFEAWQFLFLMGEDQEIDAGISHTLANRIESIWNADQNNSLIARDNQTLQLEVERSGRTADMIAGSIRENLRDEARKDKSSSPAPDTASLVTKMSDGPGKNGGQLSSLSVPTSANGTMELANEYLKNLEARARIRLNEVKMSENMEKAKKEFSDHISILFNTRKFNHVIIAAEFYCRIFLEGEYPASMAQQVNSALDSNRSVKSSLDVFRYKVERNEISSAAARLQEAFIINEFHPGLLALERSLKEKVADYFMRVGRIQNLVEARDYTNLEKALSEMKDRYVDFDIAKPLGLVTAIKLESTLRLGKAKLLAQQGNLAQAIEEFQTAAEAWPANPDLKQAADLFFNSQDFANQSIVEFDRMMAEQDYRSIYDKQLVFAPAVRGDTKREQQLKASLNKVRLTDSAMEKAEMLLLNEDISGAWETIELAAREWPDDKKMNKLRAELAGKSANFISALNKAMEAEEKKEFGYSLSWYVNARKAYPSSQIANTSIQRLSHLLFEEKVAK